MPRKNPLSGGLNMTPTTFRPVGIVYAPGSKWTPPPFPNGKAKASPPQQKKK